MTGVNNSYDPVAIAGNEYSNKRSANLASGTLVNPKVYIPGIDATRQENEKAKANPHNLKNVDRGLYDMLVRDREYGLSTGKNSLPYENVEIDDLI